MSIEKARAEVVALQAVHRAFDAGTMTSVEHARAREKHIAQALREIASEHGVRLQEPVQIDSNGEFSVVAMPPDGRDPNVHGCGRYGEAFAAVLTAHNARTGVRPGAILDPQNGWCRINHFDAERLVGQCVLEAERDRSKLHNSRGLLTITVSGADPMPSDQEVRAGVDAAYEMFEKRGISPDAALADFDLAATKGTETTLSLAWQDAERIALEACFKGWQRIPESACLSGSREREAAALSLAEHEDEPTEAHAITR